MSEENKNIESSNTETVTEQQVWDVFEFARNAYTSSSRLNVYTPSLINQRMKDINMNPLKGTADEISTALQNPKNNEEQLIGFSEFFEYTDMMYKRILSTVALTPAFDVTYLPINLKSFDDLSKSQYKSDEKKVEEFLNNFDIKSWFTSIMKQMLRQETYYGVFRDEGNRYIMQELPRTYCKTTGRSEFGLLYDFDMNWFIQPSVDINMYPDIFKKFYNRVYGTGNLKGERKYVPSNPINNRNGSYVYDVQTSMEDGFWAFKFNDTQAGDVPYFSPMFNDLVLAPQIRQLQTNKYIIEASKLIIGLVPLLKDNKSGNVRDMMAIAPETLGKFLGLLRNSINDVYSLGAVPFEDVKSIDFKTNNINSQTDFNKNMSASSGMTRNIIYNSDKMNAIETKYSIAVDELIATQIYPQFEKFLEFEINKRTTTYKFKFKLEGSNFPDNRKERLDTQMKLMEKGIVLPQKIAAALGMMPSDFEVQRQMAVANGFVDSLTPVINASQMSSSESSNKSGRTRVNESDMTESGLISRENGSNIAKGGDV